MLKETLTEEAKIFSIQFKEDLESLNMFSYFDIILPLERTRANDYPARMIQVINSRAVKSVWANNSLIAIHPELRKTSAFPSKSFRALKEAMFTVVGGHASSLDAELIIPVFRELKRNIFQFAEQAEIEPNDENVSKLLFLGSVRSLGGGLTSSRKPVSYIDTSNKDRVWDEMVKYVKKGYQVNDIIGYLSAYVEEDPYGMKPSIAKPFITVDLAEELSLSEMPVDWQEVMLSSHFNEKIKLPFSVK